MKKLQWLNGLLPHASIVFAISFIVFSILDWYNPLMNFTGNPISSKLLIIFCVISLVTSVERVVEQSRKSK